MREACQKIEAMKRGLRLAECMAACVVAGHPRPAIAHDSTVSVD